VLVIGTEVGVGALFSAAFAFPFFMLVNTQSQPLIWFALVLGISVGVAAMFGAQAAYFAELFGTSLRYSGFAFARELGSIFAGGLGLSAYFGTELHLADLPPTHSFEPLDVFGLGDLWVFGPILFDQSALVYASWVLTAAVALYLTRTRWGLNVRAVGGAPPPSPRF